MTTPEERLVELNIQLPALPAAAGLYTPVVRTGNLIFVSGQLPLREGEVARHGKLGANVDPDEGFELAGICALNALAHLRVSLGTLDAVSGPVRVAGYVASAPGFIEHSRVVNGASQVLLDVFGPDAGKHARIAIGVAELPLGVPVEVEFLFEAKPA